MSKKSVIQRNLKRCALFKFYKRKRIELSSLKNNKNMTLKKRFEAQLSFSTIPRNSSNTRIRNRCILSGRGRGVYRVFKLSRIWIRTLAAEGKLPGVTKSSW